MIILSESGFLGLGDLRDLGGSLCLNHGFEGLHGLHG